MNDEFNEDINNFSLNQRFKLQNINNLPEDMVREINSYIPKHYFVYTNKTNLNDYHETIKPIIMRKNLFETYVRDMIKRDNDFIFSYILHENYNKWIFIKNYMDDFTLYPSYLSFLMNFCIIHNADKCRIILKNYIDLRNKIMKTKYKKYK
jgi:hypothetical protein